MIELMLVLAVISGAVWLTGALIGLVFKLIFGVVGAVFGLLMGAIGLFIGGVVLLCVLPILALSLLPLCLPVLLLLAMVWAISRGVRHARVAQPLPH